MSNLIPLPPTLATPIKKTWRWIVVHIISAKIIIAVLCAVAFAQYVAPGPLQQDDIVLVERGTGVRDIATMLKDKKIIRSEYLFIAGVLATGHRHQLKAGEYAFSSGQSLQRVIAELVRGQTLIRSLTIPEGLTVKQIVKLVNDAPALAGEVTTNLAEGSLMPDTYYYSRNDKRDDLVLRMQTAQASFLLDVWDKRAPNLPFQTPQQAITLASIVEKETGVVAERAKVAGVFINRLRLDMKLQADPTVIYGLTDGGGELGRPLYRSDWQHPSPYNTYVHKGLPPAPIANPGREAIRAALNPEQHDYLFFVADGTGGHRFAVEYGDHNDNIDHWRNVQKKRNQDTGKNNKKQ